MALKTKIKIIPFIVNVPKYSWQVNFYRNNLKVQKLKIRQNIFFFNSFVNLFVVRGFYKHLISYATPININYWLSFGALSGLVFAIQLISGILLVMFYIPDMSVAFYSVENIMRNVNNGLLLRYLHANCASFFFIVVYIHIGRALYYQSYFAPRNLLLLSGVLIFFLMMLVAFLGYVLPWGQMSYLGATVITNFFTAVPIIGESIAQLILGGFTISNATLTRFFSLHYCVPFILAVLIILHILILHNTGSTNPLSISHNYLVFFYPYFYIKDFFCFFVIICLLIINVGLFPNFFGHSDNYIMANSLNTPIHIVPELYFLPFYAILRSIPNKIGGICFMVAAIFIVLLLILNNLNFLLFNNFKINYLFDFMQKFFISIFCCIYILLTFLGMQAIEYPYINFGYISTGIYFLFFSYFFFNLVFIKAFSLLVISKYRLILC